MLIKVEVSQEELDEVGVTASEMYATVREAVDNGEVQMQGFNVEVTVYPAAGGKTTKVFDNKFAPSFDIASTGQKRN